MSNVSDIYTKGYVKFYEPDGLDLIKINDHRLLNTEERARDNGKEDIDKAVLSISQKDDNLKLRDEAMKALAL